MLLLTWFLLLFSLTLAVSDNGSSFAISSGRMIVISTIFLLIETPELFGFGGGDMKTTKRYPSTHRKRKRRTVMSIFSEMGPHYVRRAYRMDGADFWKLHAILRPYLENQRVSRKKKRHRNGAKNGLIPTLIYLSAALRYFAGGSPYDISVVHGLSHSEVFASLWRVVDSSNRFERLAFHSPTCHDKQREIANGFKSRSMPQFTCCARCIDGMLLWIEKPSELECDEATCGLIKFFCGQKKKFGLNLQGTCDVEGRFLDNVFYVILC